MRGRTNIVQRLGATVNGDVITATATENIEGGSFVSWKFNPQLQSVYSSQVDVNGSHDLGNGLFLSLIDRKLTLFQYNGSLIVILNVFSELLINRYCYDSETGFIYGIDSNSRLLRFKVENQTILTVKTFTGNANYSGDMVALQGNIYLIRASAATTYTNFTYTKFLLSEDGSFSVTSGVSIDSINVKTTEQSYSVVGNRIYYYLTVNDSSSTPRKYFRLIVIEFLNDTFTLTNIFSISLGYTTGVTSGKAYFSEVVEKSGKGFILVYGTSSSTENNFVNPGSMVVFDLQTHVNNVIPLNGVITSSSGMSGVRKMSEFLTDSLVIACLGNFWMALSFNFNTIQLTLHSNLVENSFASNVNSPDGIWFLKRPNNVAFLHESGSALNFIIDGTILIPSEDSNEVQNYDKNIGSIGFAKTGAAQGSEIQVYVPPQTQS